MPAEVSFEPAVGPEEVIVLEPLEFSAVEFSSVESVDGTVGAGEGQPVKRQTKSRPKQAPSNDPRASRLKQLDRRPTW